jgi:hypothetical protein
VNGAGRILAQSRRGRGEIENHCGRGNSREQNFKYLWLEIGLRLDQKVRQFQTTEVVGETPTTAVETTALP